MKKRFLSVLLALVLVVGMIPISTMTASAKVTAPDGVWNDHAASNFDGGDGSEDNPFQIATAEQLAKLSKDVSNREAYSGKFFKITENIDLSAHRWVPIGLSRWEDDDTEYGNTTNNEPFRGFIDGNNKTLTGLYVDESTTQYSAGFIGNIVNSSGNKVGVKDLSIVNAEIIADESGLMELNAGILVGTTMANEGYTISFENITVSGNISVTKSYGRHKVGGMIGSANRLTVKNCKAESISIIGATNAGGIVGCDGGSTFENCTASGKISGGWSLGGFVGYSTSVDGGNTGRSTYTKCAANVEITGDDWCLGGFVGCAEYGKFDECVSTGKVTSTVTTFNTKIGGFMGESDYAVADKCHTASKVISASTDYNPGGFVGYFEGGTFTDCSFDNEKNSGFNAAGKGIISSGVEGGNTNEILSNICKDYYGNSDHKYGTDNVCTDCGYTLAYWTDDGNYDISWYVGHESDYSYEIADAADLAGLAVLVNGLNGQTAVDFSYSISPSVPAKFPKTIILKNDIDLSGKLWTPIGTTENSFMGTFDGNGKTVTNMTVVASKSFAGLFGCVGDSGTSTGLQIYNLKVTSSSVTATDDSANYIAGIVGYMVNGTLRNCSYGGTVSAKGQFVAGVIAQPEKSNVTNCVNYATVTATGTEARQVGGVVGDSMGWVKNCANFGTVTGYSSVGGIAGKVSLNSLENCYNVGIITATNTYETAGAIVGYVLPPTYGVSSIANCYFLEGTATEALGSAKAEFKTTMYSVSKTDFTSGKVAYSLNGKNGGTNFYQNLDNGKTADEYPLPDSTHGTVYMYTVYAQCDKGDTTPVVKYSNTSTADVVPNHIYQYSANGNIIIETCKNCEIHEETVVLVILSENELVYSGQAHTPVSVNYSNGWQGGTLTVYYENNVNAGTNTASAYITVGDEKAVFKFSIAKADNKWLTEPTISGWTFGKTAVEPNSKAKFGEVKVTYSGTANDGTPYNSDQAPTNAGSYKAIFTVDGTNNYTKLEKAIDFTIERANQSVPTGLVGTAETVDGKADGKITGLTNVMEYRKKNETVYTVITGTELTNLADGTYCIRYKGNGNYNASSDCEVVIGKGGKLTVTVPKTQVGYTLTVDKNELTWNENVILTFTLKEGYSKLDSSFAIKVNGTPITLDNEGKYTNVNVAENLTVTVEGVADITAPTTEITIAENKWSKFFNNITFGLFFKDTQKVTVTATDKGSGVDKIYYYLSATELTEEQVKALSNGDWKEYTGAFNLNPQDEYIIYAKAVDKDNNVKYISSDKTIIIDNIAPVISGIENGATYHTTQVITVTDKNLESVTVNDEPVTLGSDGKLTLNGNLDTTYAIKVTDKAGNVTEYTITMKVISDIKDSIKDITMDDVTSDDKETIENVIKDIEEELKNDDLTDEEKAELEDEKQKAEDLIKKIEEAIGSTETDNTDKVKDITSDNVKTEDKSDLEKAKDDLEKALTDYKDNLTDDEKKDIQDEIDRIKNALEVIDRVEKVEDLINKLPDNITKSDADAVKAADDAYNALSSYEKSILDENAKNKLDNAKSVLNSPATGDNGNIWMWFALVLLSGGLLGVTLYIRKKKYFVK